MHFLTQLAALAKDAEEQGERLAFYGHDAKAAVRFQIAETADDLHNLLLEDDFTGPGPTIARALADAAEANGQHETACWLRVAANRAEMDAGAAQRAGEGV